MSDDNLGLDETEEVKVDENIELNVDVMLNWENLKTKDEG